MAFDRIAVVGAGAWGTALANAIARAGRAVLLATRDRAGADMLVKARESPRLPGVRLHEHVGIAPVGADVGRYDVILLAVPSQHLRAAAGAIAPALRAGTPVIACAKGIERGTHRFMTEVIAESAPAAQPAILSGPSFAADVARGRRAFGNHLGHEPVRAALDALGEAITGVPARSAGAIAPAAARSCCEGTASRMTS